MPFAFNQKMLAAGVPLRTQQDTRVGAIHSRALPAGRVEKMVVRLPVNLSPMGNTVALTAPSEMPFTAGRPVTVQTQVSGGISGPPRSMKSKGLRGKYNATVMTNRNQGKMPFAGLGQYDEVPAYSGSAGLGDTNWGSIFGTASSVTGQVASILNPHPAAVAAPVAPKSNTTMYLVLGGLALLGVGAFVMTRK